VAFGAPVSFRDPWTRNCPRRTGQLLLCAGPGVKLARLSATARSDCPFELPDDSMPLAASRSARALDPSGALRALTATRSQSATEVPRGLPLSFRMDTITAALPAASTAHIRVHHCTVFDAPLRRVGGGSTDPLLGPLA